MTPKLLAFLAGPLVVGDFVAGSGGVLVAAVAIIAGCAFASAGNLVWFAFWGVTGVLALRRSVPALRQAHDLARRLVVPDRQDAPWPAAA